MDNPARAFNNKRMIFATGLVTTVVLLAAAPTVRGLAEDEGQGGPKLPPLSKSGKTSKAFWAFVRPRLPSIPAVKNRQWVKNALDAFVLAGLEAKGLSPSPPADRRTLIRRATFDLTGLPPTPQELRDFLSDNRPGAFERVIDRLLASPAYGERWGRHWLDVARYADSNGVDENLVYPQAWRYRDYVIRAFNQDKSIDRFIREQVAGDLLPANAEAPNNFDRIIATGYLSLGPKMLAEDDPVKQEEDIIDEQVDTIGKTFLGMTLGCARCHDHKFDPFPQTDYYALAGIFKSTKTMLNFKNMAEWQETPLAAKEDREKLEAAEAAIRERQAKRDALVKKAGDAVLAAARAKSADYARAAQEFVAAKAQGAVLAPISNDSTAPPGSILIEAEDFVRGNVLKDRDVYGKGIGVLVNAGKYPNFAEYEIEVKETGPYQLDLRYASGDSRPVHILINGKVVASSAAGEVTGGFNPDTQKWYAEGAFLFDTGKNTLRIERDSYFPHIDKLRLTPRKGLPSPRTLDQIAAENNLLPEFLRQAADQTKNLGTGPTRDLNFELPDKPERLFSAADQAAVSRFEEEIKTLEKAKPNLPRAMAVSEGKPTDLKVHIRGSYLTLGRECPRGFPAVLSAVQQTPIDYKGSGRLEFAQWLTSPQNPLTARVFVNRVWRWHFGKGIVPSTDNFGSLGDRPANQALLDWLAVEFQSAGGCGWSLKRLHKLIMLSNTYQMSSPHNPRSARIDPENKLHWRNDRRRLEVEAIRDSILAVSGQLDRTLGGTLLNFKDREYVTSTANSDPVNYKSNRRSVYLPVVRSALYDVYTTFDFGDPTVMNGDRPTTTIAPQSLFMMNSPLVLEQTKAMASSLLGRKELDDAGRMKLAYETCFARTASPGEIQRSMMALGRLDAAYAQQEPDQSKRRLMAWQSLCKSLVASSEFIYVE